MPLSRTIVGVTGATGFLGSHIALQLRALGAEVRGIVRTPSKGDWLEAHGITFVRADLSDPDSLAAAFEGCDVVVSNAALSTRDYAPWSAYEAANVDGTRNVMHALARAGVKRTVYVSSVSVYRLRPWRWLDEDTPVRERFRPDLSLFTTNWRYALSKALGERLAWELSDKHGIALTTVRPGPIYGVRDKKVTKLYSRLVDRAVLPAPTVGIPLVNAEDVARAIAAACHTPASEGRAYNLGGTTARLVDVLRLIRDLRGTRCRIVPIPVPVWVGFDDSAARTDLSFVNRPLAEGFAECFTG